jgi:hypothetical protein
VSDDIPGLGDPTVLDPGIRRAVVVLRGAGLNTFESCEGGEGHAYTEPTVRFYGAPCEGWKGFAACQSYGLPIKRLSRTWVLTDGEPSGPFWEVTFRCQLS